MSKLSSKLNRGTLKSLAFGLLYLPVILFTVAIVLYIIETEFGTNGEPVGFQLATITAVIGGFILASAFVGKEPQNSELQLKLRRIGILYLMDTVAFVVFGICFPIIEVSCWFIWVSAISMCVGALLFATGTVLLALQLLQLWSRADTETPHS